MMPFKMAADPSQKPHAIMIPFPSQGHIGPMMHLSIKLASEGFTITFVNTQHNHELLKHLQPKFGEQGLDIRFEPIRDKRGHGSTCGQDAIAELSKSFVSLKPDLEELVGTLQTGDSPLTCMVSDFYLAFTQDVATKFGLRRLSYMTSSAGTFASLMVVKQGFRPPQEPKVPGVPPLKVTDLIDFLQCFVPEDFMFNYLLEAYTRLKETEWTAVNTFEELEYASLEALRRENNPIYAVGPLLPPSYFNEGGGGLESYSTAALWQDDHACLEWLNRQEDCSVLYVSFGSIAVLTAQQFEELALGLEASQVALLWVIRPDLMYGETALFPQGYLDRVHSRTCFVPWAPQLQVLTHPSVGGFLTHCGWNSTLESISAGVPMLGWPYAGDQMLNNRCCVDAWKVSLQFEAQPNGLISRQEVENKARALMHGETSKLLRVTSSNWKKAAHAAIVPNGSSTLQWNHLFKEMAAQPKPPS